MEKKIVKRSKRQPVDYRNVPTTYLFVQVDDAEARTKRVLNILYEALSKQKNLIADE